MISANVVPRPAAGRAFPWAVCLLGLAVGCGDNSEGPPRVQVWGTVTYAGQPVSKGFVTFSPDASQGNNGPGSGAAIVDGQFVTPAGKGVVGGPHVIRIVGYDGVPATEQGEELPDGKSLFTPYETVLDLPAEPSEQNFEIPVSTE